jgi:hypothetical protein
MPSPAFPLAAGTQLEKVGDKAPLPGDGQYLYRLCSPADYVSALKGKTIVQRVLLEAGPSRTLFLPDGAVLLQVNDVYADADGVLFRRVAGRGFQYGVLSRSGWPAGLVSREVVPTYYGGWPMADEALLKECSEVPRSLSTDLRTLAQQLTQGCQNNGAKALALQHYLQTRFHYGLDYSPPADRDPIEDFVLNCRTAHCEYFASAMTLLLREVGVPARYVVGFMVREHHTGSGGYYVVRECDAHAWCEAYLPGEGWHAFDATPPDAAALPVHSDTLLDSTLERMDLWYAEFTTQSWKVNLASVVTALRRGVASRAGLETLGAVLLGVGWVLLRRRTHPLGRRPNERARVRGAPTEAAVVRLEAALRELERLVSSGGARHPASRTLHESLSRISDTLTPDQATRASEVVRRYYGLRYGPGTPAVEECQALEKSIRVLRHDIRVKRRR